VVNCVNLNATHSRENYWLLGRVYPLPAAARARADEIGARVLDLSRVRTTEQEFARYENFARCLKKF
jgi:hypothetical protein